MCQTGFCDQTGACCKQAEAWKCRDSPCARSKEQIRAHAQGKRAAELVTAFLAPAQAQDGGASGAEALAAAALLLSLRIGFAENKRKAAGKQPGSATH